MRRLDSREKNFTAELDLLLARQTESDGDIESAVRAIIDAVRQRGDDALVELTNRYDGRQVRAAADFEVQDFASHRANIDPATEQALVAAAARIRRYHERQLQDSWDYQETDGIVMGQIVNAIDKVGVYVPGGKAAYPSSVLMNVIPAKVAGVGHVTMVVPAPQGELAPVVLAAADIAGVDQVYSIGGAQAVAALAYGTETIAAVDKIVGPGNIYVATAKSLVFGQVGIDMIAGPSEIAIVCDGQTDPDWIALDLFAQAEHDENAQAILITPDANYIDAVTASIERLLPNFARRDIIAAALSSRGAFIRVRDLAEALEIVNRIAPEHLELSVASPRDLLGEVKHAGAIFLGRHTPEAFGDYCAGPNHVLPTAGTARFFSPLGVYDFQKRSSLIECTPSAASRLAPTAVTLARGEGLDAHAESAAARSRNHD